MDLMHAHYVKNLNEGIAALDGTDSLYSKPRTRGYQPYWDSMVLRLRQARSGALLLSNIKYWIEGVPFRRLPLRRG